MGLESFFLAVGNGGASRVDLGKQKDVCGTYVLVFWRLAVFVCVFVVVS